MFNDAQEKEFDVVLVWKIDRFFRKILYLLE
jgi:DNA invertase Pin-like site-specific DNA recombinase